MGALALLQRNLQRPEARTPPFLGAPVAVLLPVALLGATLRLYPAPTWLPSSPRMAAPVGCAQVTVPVPDLAREHGSDFQASALGSPPSSVLQGADGVRGRGLRPCTTTPCPVYPVSHTGGCHTLLSLNAVNSPTLELLLEQNQLPKNSCALVT